MMRFSRGHGGLWQVAWAFGMLGLSFAVLTVFLAARAGAECRDILLDAGVDDSFSTANGAEPATPSAGLLVLMGPNPADFDSTSLNQPFGHTFTLPQGDCIVGARLEFRAKPLADAPSGSDNDAISLGFVNAGGQFVSTHWTAFFGSGNTAPPPAILGNQWGPTNYPAGNMFVLDLGNLVGGVNLLPDLDLNRFLDIYIQDDTSVDYLRLVVSLCDCPTPTATSTSTATTTPTHTSTSTPTHTPTKAPTVTPTATTSPSPCAQPPPGMVAWYPLDEQQGATAVNDIAPPPSSVFNNFGTPQPGPVGLSGPPNVVGLVGAGALYFYTGNSVEVSPQAELDFGPNDFSIDAWVRPVGCGPGHLSPIVDKLDSNTNTGFSFYLDQPPPAGTAVLKLQVNASTFTSTGSIPANANPLQNTGPWSHIAVAVQRTGTSAVGTFYINGSASGTFVPPAGTVTNTLPMWIGKIRAGGDCEIAIDELELFNRALAQSEIQEIFDAGSAGKCRTSTTPTPSGTPAVTATPTPPLTATPTPTPTPPPTATPTPTPTLTPTRPFTATPTPTPTCGEPISVIISTGRNAVPIGSSDQVWSLIAAPPGTTGFSSPGPATVIASNAGWTTLPNTQWIAANPGCTDTTTTDCPGGLYSYQLCWDQCGPLASSPLLQILADNTATVSLDGTPLTTIPTNTIGFMNPETIQGFTPGPGIHTLQVDVYNNPFSGGGGTATGMDLGGILNGSVRIIPCPCVGDCDGDGQVTINEILTMVNIALGNAGVSTCMTGDANHDGQITIDEILAAVNNALNGCSTGTPPPTPTPGGPCGTCGTGTYHAHCDVSGPSVVCVDNSISSGATCASDSDCTLGALPFCVAVQPDCSSGNNHCYKLCP